MVKLKNIEKNNNIINCLIYPEDSKEAGQLTCNISNKEIEYYELPKGYEWCVNHVYHAAYNIFDMAEANKIQKELTVQWV